MDWCWWVGHNTVLGGGGWGRGVFAFDGIAG